ncbi:alcohol dehydrogenase catalytic domain-containing protein [Microbispora sp. NBRC 16548]|uniref:zinc-binding dehydrogenase n=1 Tax=Microbispora sp. NBRC 16548 TaxID=3030994 RepID=UPI0024A23291|nr:alcohol dehydrogenase catalytic domain-containing protein [Microbispora sp. NBRC 16548]GLX11129.1 2-deoxy-scyllo-inosamine dehydrogenase [Microbispora sp. NBRC 16548]
MHTAARTTEPFTVGLSTADAAELSDGEVRLRVECVGICGTDLHIFDGSYPVDYPVIQGHEISARVIEVSPAAAARLAVGDRVAIEPVTSCGQCRACRHGLRNTCQRMIAVGVHRPGGFQEELVVPAGQCHPAGSLSPTATALAETLSVSLRAVTRPSVTERDRVVILGAGPIGLGAVLAATDRGARVLVVDQHEARLDLAAELGAEETVSGLARLPQRVLDWTDGDGADVVIEATGSPAVAPSAFDVVATGGRISIVGVSEQELRVSMRLFTSKELDVFGSRATLDFPGAVALSRRYEAKVSSLVSHRFALPDVRKALRYALDEPQSVIKTVIDVS